MGAGENAETHQTPRPQHIPGRRPIYADDFARLRAQDPGYFDWLRRITPAAGCTRPIRLAGEKFTADRHTGELLDHLTTTTMPDGVIYKACGNRRASVCPSCAEVYRRDAYQLIRAGLAGGKGIPATVSGHPAVFATFVDCAWTATTTTPRSSSTTRPRSCGGAPPSPSAVPCPGPPARSGFVLPTSACRSGETHFTTPAHPGRPAGWPMASGDEGQGRYADLRPVKVTGDGDITDAMVAAYPAKYATKSTEATGHVSGRITGDLIDLYADPDGTHPERLVHAAWALGCNKQWGGLRRWAHMLGFGGHFLTRSRRYSVTFRILRDARVIWRRTVDHDDQADDDEETTVVINALAYTGAGWRNTGDAMLANQAAAAARERDHFARTAARETTSLDTYVSTVL